MGKAASAAPTGPLASGAASSTASPAKPSVPSAAQEPNIVCPKCSHGMHVAPNSGINAQALAGAWNWLFEQCEALAKAREGATK
jgi:hypothetical protein